MMKKEINEVSKAIAGLKKELAGADIGSTTVQSLMLEYAEYRATQIIHNAKTKNLSPKEWIKSNY